MSTQSDPSGQKYISNDNQPAPHGAPVKIQTNGGLVPGTMVNGYVVPNKQS